jgi:hypothetical protein
LEALKVLEEAALWYRGEVFRELVEMIGAVAWAY